MLQLNLVHYYLQLCMEQGTNKTKTKSWSNVKIENWLTTRNSHYDMTEHKILLFL